MPVMLKVTVTEKSWIRNPRERWNAGLIAEGEAWKLQNKMYPDTPHPTYARTGALGNSAEFEIVRFGEQVWLKALAYWKFLMYGTGIYGARGTPIYPVRAKFLVFRVTGSGMGVIGGVRGFVFARSVKGTIWRGRLDQIILALKEAYAEGVKNYYDFGQFDE